MTAALTGSAAPAAVGAIVVTSKTWLWYLTRSTGLVALLLLTASMALGLLSGVRWQGPGWPRFVTAGLHRNMSALACAVVVVHIVTTLADGFVPIYIQDAVLPFGSAYRPLWLGLGAASFDLMLVLIVTSLVPAPGSATGPGGPSTGPRTCAGQLRSCTAWAPARTPRCAGFCCSPWPASR